MARPTESALGKKRRFVILLTPEEIGILESRYGTVQKGIRALLAAESYPRPAPADATPCPPPPPALCERCARIGVPSCPSCRRTVEIDS
jgi:hypothetical protein